MQLLKYSWPAVHLIDFTYSILMGELPERIAMNRNGDK